MGSTGANIAERAKSRTAQTVAENQAQDSSQEVAVPDGTPDQAITEDAAREHAERIRGYINSIAQHVEVWGNALITAYKENHHVILGYGQGADGWEAYCNGEFNDSLSHLRSVYVIGQAKEMHDAGMSLRAIEIATGISKSGLQRAISEMEAIEPPTGEPGKSKGLDGKQQPARKPRTAPVSSPETKTKPKDSKPKGKIEQCADWAVEHLNANGPQSDYAMSTAAGKAGFVPQVVSRAVKSDDRLSRAAYSYGDLFELREAEQSAQYQSTDIANWAVTLIGRFGSVKAKAIAEAVITKTVQENV